MRYIIKALLSFSAIGLLINPAFVAASPVLALPIEVSQPEDELSDIATFNIYPKGDEWGNWDETQDGYSVIRDSATGIWRYAKKNAQGKLKPSRAVVGRDNPKAKAWGLKKHQAPSRRPQLPFGLSRASAKPAVYTALEHALSTPSIDATPTLFILVSFSDKSGTYTASNFADFQSNQLQRYFRETSYGRFQTVPATESFGTLNDGIVGWLPLNQNHPNPGGSVDSRNRQLTADAIKAADPYVDYASYDFNNDGYLDSDELAVVVIPAGYETSYGGSNCAGTPSVWGHHWSLGWGTVAAPTVDGVIVGDYHLGNGGYAQFGEIHGIQTSCAVRTDHQATLGIMAHELGHLILHWIDLYDTDYTSAGLGNFSLMSRGTWSWKPGDLYHGQTPVHPDGWSKLYAGWVDPVYDIVGFFTLPAAGSGTATATNAVQIQTTSDPKQYYLFENRSQYGYDRGLYRVGSTTGGIAVLHIDENISDNDNEGHKKVDLVEADNDLSMDIDPYNSGKPTNLFYWDKRTKFGDATIPNSRLYSGLPTNITLDSVSAVQEEMTAVFVPRYELTLPNSRAGTVISSPWGIRCGRVCAASFSAGTVVTLTAMSLKRHTFIRWGGACSDSGNSPTCALTMDSPKNVTAAFQ
ncbi:M6 family metalloprotease domain-containing protein [Methylomicrobium lacus]|uniref:M6 family metalloprotease domain-containing protein n=1 Tax=Methylomicrobium lacus TaxID=136992 RepID=UPI00045E91BD|nr:M6 family metalloprotease domain-containing protein [Methylomicrobium lacus]